MIAQLPCTIPPDSCENIIEQVRPLLTPAKVGPPDDRIAHFSRIADNYIFQFDLNWTLKLRELASLLSKSPISLVDHVEVIRYPVGGYRMRHLDRYWSHTLNIYLNNAYLGGNLFFDQLGNMFSDIPTGLGLFWENSLRMSHECKPILSGEKWLITVGVKHKE